MTSLPRTSSCLTCLHYVSLEKRHMKLFISPFRLFSTTYPYSLAFSYICIRTFIDKDHEDNERSDNSDLVTEEVKKTKKNKANIDQHAQILTDMSRTIPTEDKHEKLRALIEEHNMGKNEGYEETSKDLFADTESEHNTLKSKLIKAM